MQGTIKFSSTDSINSEMSIYLMCYLKYRDILQLMIEASGEEGDSDGEEKEAEPPAECPAHKVAKTKGIMTDAEVVENSMLFLFAGKETTAITMSFTSYLLALHPDVQEKLQSKIDAYFEEKPVSYVYPARALA